MVSLTLYHHPLSSFCHKGLIALYENDIEYVDHDFVGEHPLIPNEFEQALEVRLWDRIFDNHVQGPMQAIVNDRIRGANGDLGGARSTLQTAYGMIDRQMTTRNWIAGQSFSMADCAAAPALFYASTLEPFTGEYKHLSAYFERLTERPSYRRVLEEAKPYFSMYPFADAIPKQFR